MGPHRNTEFKFVYSAKYLQRQQSTARTRPQRPAKTLPRRTEKRAERYGDA